MKIAHVGGNPDGSVDQWHMTTVWKWAMDNDPEMAQRVQTDNHEEDLIDLNDGRDFLEEFKKYDIVILHLIYAPHDNSRDIGLFNQSVLHSPDQWRRRLVDTLAEYIFAIGDNHGDTEVNARYLKEIDGYEKDVEEWLTVYKKINPPTYQA